jgi:hypothetical protein
LQTAGWGLSRICFRVPTIFDKKSKKVWNEADVRCIFATEIKQIVTKIIKGYEKN